MASIYRRFAGDYSDADFSDEAALAMFLHESEGVKMPQKSQLNGFVLGKKWMDVVVSMWREDIAQLGLSVRELQDDGYPDWFLQRMGILDLQPELAACQWWLPKDFPETARRAGGSSNLLPKGLYV